jgi:hypothetical protein
MKNMLEENKNQVEKITKKDRIQELWTAGEHDVWKIAKLSETKPSYAATVLQNAGLLKGYFDLYTTTSQEMNVYSQLFRGIMGFKDEATALRSMKWLHRIYCEFRESGDRAGQHHALATALTMYDRARWSNKRKEANIFRRWLISRLNENENFLPPRPPIKTISENKEH